MMVNDNTVIKPNPDCNAAQMTLSPHEGFILSRIEGPVRIGDVVSMSLFDQGTTHQLIKNLIDKGALVVASPEESPQSPARQRADTQELPRLRGWNYRGTIFNLSELNDGDDLDEETKKILLYLEQNLEKMHYYSLLNIRADTPTKVIKERYYELSRMLHPDRYFGRDIGGYAVKMNKVFRKINEAMSTLTDNHKRMAYDEKLIKVGLLQQGDVYISEEERERLLAQERQEQEEASKRRRMKHNPFLPRIKKGREFYEQALEHAKNGQILEAYNTLKLALSYDPKNEEYIELEKGYRRKADIAKAQKEYQKAEELEKREDPSYIDQFEQLAIRYPEDARFQFKFSQVCVELNNAADALRYARRAVEVSPGDMRYLFHLAELLGKMRKRNEAAKVYEQILAINPSDKKAKAGLKDSKNILKRELF